MEDELRDLAILAEVVVRSKRGELLLRRETSVNRQGCETREGVGRAGPKEGRARARPPAWAHTPMALSCGSTHLLSSALLADAHAYDVNHVLDDDADILEVSPAQGLELPVRLGLVLLQERQAFDPAEESGRNQTKVPASEMSSRTHTRERGREKEWARKGGGGGR